MDDYQAVRELLPVPPLSPEVERRGRERLAAAFAQDPVRRGRRTARWSALSLGLAGAAAAAALVISAAAPPQAPPATHVAVAPLDAKALLLAAASSAATVPDEGAWWGTRLVWGREFADPGNRYVLRQTESEEIWIPADPEGSTWYRRTYLGAKPAGAQDEAAWRTDGSPTSWTYDKGAPGLITDDRAKGVVQSAQGEPRTWSSEDWDFRIVLAGRPLTKMGEVPTTPEGLRGFFGEVDDQALIDNVARLLVFAPVASETRAAAYRLLASMPGVAAAGQVSDPLGRAGQAIEYRSAEFSGQRARLVIDPATGAPLSLEIRSTSDGRLLEFTAIRESAWANDNPLKEKK